MSKRMTVTLTSDTLHQRIAALAKAHSVTQSEALEAVFDLIHSEDALADMLTTRLNEVRVNKIKGRTSIRAQIQIAKMEREAHGQEGN